MFERGGVDLVLGLYLLVLSVWVPIAIGTLTPHHTDGTVYARGRIRTCEGTKPPDLESGPFDRLGTRAETLFFTKIEFKMPCYRALSWFTHRV